MLQHQLEEENWGPVVHIVHLIKFMAQCKPYMVSQLAAAGAPRVLMAVMKGILEGGEGPDATEIVMAQTSELLLCLVETDQEECAADVLTAESVAVMMQALTSPLGGTQARQHLAHLIRHIVSSGPAWRGPLLAHGGLEGLPRALHDPVAACDLLFMQEVLWALVGLVDAAVADGGDVRIPPIILGTLVPLLQLLQLPQLSHLSHVAALIVRVLHVLASGDDHSKQFFGQVGVVDLLVEVIKAERKAEMAAAADGAGVDGVGSGWPASAPSFGRTSVTSPSARLSEPNAERLAQMGLTPLSRPSVEAQGSAALRRSHSHGRGGAAAATPGAVVSGWDRLMAVLLLREILVSTGAPETPRAGANGVSSDAAGARLSCSSMAMYGLLLPVLVDGHTNPVHRLCVVKEAVVAVKVLVSDSSVNQERAVAAGALPVLVHLVATGDVTLAWQAADALSNLSSEQHASLILSYGVVEELTHLLQESADALHLLTVRKQLEEHAVTGSKPELPSPHAAYAHKPRHRKTGNSAAPRVQLVGRQQLSFSVSGCMYTTHGSYSMCDYCVPSACLRALLRILGVCTTASTVPPLPPAASAASTPQGSKATSRQGSVTSTPANHPVAPAEGTGAAVAMGGAQRFAAAGGLYAMFLLLHHELSGSHHSKMASSLISLLNIVLDTGMDVQDEVRKVGGLALLVSLMESLARPHGLTDIYQLRVQVCLAMQRIVEANSANKLLARERGLIPLLATLLQSSLDPDSAQVLDDREQVTACVLDLLSACIADSPGNQEALLSAGGLRLISNMLIAATQPPPPSGGRQLSGPTRLKGSVQVLSAAVRTMGLLIQSCVPAQLALLGSPVLKILVQFAEHQLASHLAQCVVFTACQLMRAHPQGKSHASGSGLLTLLLKMLHTTPPGPHVAAAAQGLYALCLGDVDTQNEVVAQGGLGMIESLIRNGGVWRVHALWLLCCLMHGNSFVKNAARQTDGLVASLMGVIRKQGLEHQDLTVAAAHALAQLCQSNHSNQELLADEGGLEAVADILQVALQQADKVPASATARRNLPPLPNGSQANNTVAIAAETGPAAELGGLAAAAQYPGVLDAALRLLAAMLEFNATNKKLVRESGCLGLVADLLQRAAEVRDLSALRRALLLPAITAACAVVARAAQDCEANQQRLVTGHEDLAPALFRLLSIEEPYVALEASRALEYMVIRSDLVHDRDEDRPEFEADAIRTIVNVLHTRGGPVAPPGAVVGTAGPGAGAQGAAGNAGTVGTAAFIVQAGFWGQARTNGELGGTASAYGAAPPLGVVTSASVREAATVLLAIVKAAQAAAKAASHSAANGIHDGMASGLATPRVGASGSVDAGTQRSATIARMFQWRPPPPSGQGPAKAGPAGTGAEAGVNVAAAQQAEANGAGMPDDGAQSGYEEEGDEPGSPEITPAPSGHALPGQHIRSMPVMQPLDALTMDHANGLLAIRSLQNPDGAMGSDDWVRLVGQSAAAFQPITALVSEGPWRSVKVHLCWLLFLLAARSQANRELLAKLERSVVTPVAGQLANAEAFYASAEAAEAVAAASTALPVSVPAQDMQRNGSFKHPVAPSASANATPIISPSKHPSPRTSTSQLPSPPVSSPAQLSSSPATAGNGIGAIARSKQASSGGFSTQQQQQQQQPVMAAQQPQLTTVGSGSSALAGAGSHISDDDELEYIRREVEMLAGVGSHVTGRPG